MIRDAQDRYWRLCPEDVYCKLVADNRSELDTLSQNQAFLADWYMAAPTAQAKEKLGLLPPGRKYHLKIPGVLGGEYVGTNICTISQIEQIRCSGDIGLQIKELPDGTQIQLNISE